MKRVILLLLAAALLICCTCGCSAPQEKVNIAATTRPVWEFTSRLCSGSNLSVKLLISDSVSCLHDYSLSVKQAKVVENADVIILSGAGLESTFEAMFGEKDVIDSSAGIQLLGCSDEQDSEHDHHSHESDAHIWLSPNNAKLMVNTICHELTKRYPQYESIFRQNRNKLFADLDELIRYGRQELSSLSTREMITFHDGFSYLAKEYDLHIIKNVEEESGSEASAAELKELIHLVRNNQLPAIFTEASGSIAAASVIANETGISIFTLDMAMSELSYFEAMYHNIDTIKEALG